MNQSWALVLGGTKGLGKEICEQLLSRGRSVLVVGRSQKSFEATVSNSSIRFLFADLSNLNSVHQLIAKLEEAKVQINEFYWVAGVLERHAFEELAEEPLLRMIDVNLRNPLILAQWAWKLMQNESSQLRFVVIASTAGVSTTPRNDEAVYAATKSAQVALARALGKNNKRDQLKVSLLCPGGMKTEFWNHNEIEPETFQSFLDPKKVAEKILTLVEAQTTPFEETIIPRGSL